MNLEAAGCILKDDVGILKDDAGILEDDAGILKIQVKRY